MNNLIRRPGQQMFAPPAPGTRDGNWVWDGSNWVCDPDCDDGSGFPPFGPPVFSGPTNQPPWYPGANGGVSFGAVAPPNPVRGHMWWNGTTFFLFDGAAWVPFGGAVSGATTPPSTTAPANPQPGQQWFNGTTLYVWDGNAWVPVSQTKTTIQATAPPSPNPGDLWFDGTQLRIWSGSTWNLVGPGATVGPVPTTTEVFAFMVPTSFTIGAAWGPVNFPGTPTIDTLAGWDAVTGKYTPNKAGVYYAASGQYYGGSGTTGGGNAILKNDSGTFNVNAQNYVGVGVYFGVPNTAGIYLQSEGFIKMNGTTDFMRVWSFLTGGSSLWYPISSSVPALQVWLMP
jgi:hypothetical protein